MKRFVKTLILCLLLLALALSMFACGKNFSVKEGFASAKGSVNGVNGGAIAETENFYYVINGIGVNGDNSFGKPLEKGSLYAVKKDFSASAVVVPKLLIATDYNSGFYIFDGRVYFATPSTDKDLSGAVKSANLVFASCKLDGTDYQEYATTNELSTEFRVVKVEQAVLIYYYDSFNKALVEYNTSTKTSKEIVKTDATKDESLNSYEFFDNANLDKGVVAYTVDVYTKPLIDGSRGSAEKYNKLYVVKAGGEKVLVKNGGDKTTNVIKNTANGDEKYEIQAIVNGEILYKATNVSNSTGMVVLGSNTLEETTKYDNTYIFVGDDFYTLNSEKTEITKNGTKFATISDVTTLLDVNGEYIYYINSASKIARIKADVIDEENKAEVVTKNTVATDWYKPVIKNNILFYCDNSTEGASNIKYIDLTKELAEKFLTERTTADKVAELGVRIDNISTFLDSNGGIEDLEKTEAELKEIDTEFKKYNESETASIKTIYEGLADYREAIRLSKLCNEKLAGIDGKLTDVAKTEYQEKYNEVRAEFTKLEKKGQDYVTSICKKMNQKSYGLFYNAKTNVFEKA